MCSLGFLPPLLACLLLTPCVQLQLRRQAQGGIPEPEHYLSKKDALSALVVVLFIGPRGAVFYPQNRERDRARSTCGFQDYQTLPKHESILKFQGERICSIIHWVLSSFAKLWQGVGLLLDHVVPMCT